MLPMTMTISAGRMLLYVILACLVGFLGGYLANWPRTARDPAETEETPAPLPLPRAARRGRACKPSHCRSPLACYAPGCYPGSGQAGRPSLARLADPEPLPGEDTVPLSALTAELEQLIARWPGRP